MFVNNLQILKKLRFGIIIQKSNLNYLHYCIVSLAFEILTLFVFPFELVFSQLNYTTKKEVANTYIDPTLQLLRLLPKTSAQSDTTLCSAASSFQRRECSKQDLQIDAFQDLQLRLFWNHPIKVNFSLYCLTFSC